MIAKDGILREESEFPKLFASYVEKPYGILFYNDADKDSHDSNHALLYPDKITDFANVVSDITNFYVTRNITPRIYQPYISGYFNTHKETLQNLRYEIQMYGNNKFMILSEKNTITQSGCIDIRRITRWDDRIATDIYIPAREEYGIDVEKNSLKNENYYLFGGFLGNELLCIVSFHISPYSCTRFDYILTAPKHRRKGYAKEVLGYVVDFCKENEFINCYQWPDNEISEKTSTAAGFRVMFEEEAGAAVFVK